MDAVFSISSKKVWGTRKNDYLLPVKCKISSQSIRIHPIYPILLYQKGFS